jgi:hypothetical protein
MIARGSTGLTGVITFYLTAFSPTALLDLLSI